MNYKNTGDYYYGYWNDGNYPGKSYEQVKSELLLVEFADGKAINIKKKA